jgi:hypothetical protein
MKALIQIYLMIYIDIMGIGNLILREFSKCAKNAVFDHLVYHSENDNLGHWHCYVSNILLWSYMS